MSLPNEFHVSLHVPSPGMEKPKNGSLSKLNQIIAENGDPGLSGLPPSTVKGAGEGEQAQSGAKQDEAARFRRRGHSNERLR